MEGLKINFGEIIPVISLNLWLGMKRTATT